MAVAYQSGGCNAQDTGSTLGLYARTANDTGVGIDANDLIILGGCYQGVAATRSWNNVTAGTALTPIGTGITHSVGGGNFHLGMAYKYASPASVESNMEMLLDAIRDMRGFVVMRYSGVRSATDPLIASATGEGASGVATASAASVDPGGEGVVIAVGASDGSEASLSFGASPWADRQLPSFGPYIRGADCIVSAAGAVTATVTGGTTTRKLVMAAAFRGIVVSGAARITITGGGQLVGF